MKLLVEPCGVRRYTVSFQLATSTSGADPCRDNAPLYSDDKGADADQKSVARKDRRGHINKEPMIMSPLHCTVTRDPTRHWRIRILSLV
ncbi:hypothetical protein OS493_037994, partial [Desmophyllum pertusum]